MQDLGFDNVINFFRACEAVSIDENMDMCLSMLCGIIELAKKQNKTITMDYLKQFGKEVEYFNGVLEWFDKINNIGKEAGYVIEHYVISSGVKEIIEGTKIAKHFKRIYANCFAYKDGVAFWPSQVVNYTSKTQYVYRVRKSVLDDLRSLGKINEKMKEEDVLPFKNIIYLGDSETDIPSFKVIKNNGGLSICVFDPNNDTTRVVAQKCFLEGRVNYFAPADYREGEDLYNFIKNYILNIINQTEIGEHKEI